MKLPGKSPHSLPPSLYGGARKRLFIGLMTASCLLVCLLLGAGWLVPYVGLAALHPALPLVSGLLTLSCAAALLWICLGLVWHIYSGRRLPGLGRIRGVTVRLFLPLMELLGRALGLSRETVRQSFIKVNNEMVLAAAPRVAPQRLLLLLPHCIQAGDCPRRLGADVTRCARCGRCPVGELLRLRRRYGFRMAMATGGTIARRIVVQTRPACIVAVACERDLVSGIQDSYPLPVFGVLNSRPHGPCVDTLVDVVLLERVLRRFLADPDAAPDAPDAADVAAPIRSRAAAPDAPDIAGVPVSPDASGAPAVPDALAVPPAPSAPSESSHARLP